MKQKTYTAKILKDDIIQFGQCWARMQLIVNALGTAWEVIELSSERPLSIVNDDNKGKKWP